MSRLDEIRGRYSAEDGWFYQDMKWLLDDIDLWRLAGRLSRERSDAYQLIASEIAKTLRGQANEVDHNWSDETAAAIAEHLREVADLFEQEAGR